MTKAAVDAHAKRLVRYGLEDTAESAHRRAAAIAREVDNAEDDKRARPQKDWRSRLHGRRARMTTTIDNETGKIVEETIEEASITEGTPEEWADARERLK